MKILKIEWKNIASYGNKIQSIKFPEKASLIQVVGENGAGKSTISDVITFGLYGKLEGKKLGDIPNRINGNAWTRITFEQSGKTYEVERGLNPSLFDLKIDGAPYDQAGNRNVQDYLTDDLLFIPYYVFNNTISLSINDFKSFLKMSTKDKKLIIDKIFGFYILNEMRDLLKEEIKNIKNNLERISGELSAITRSIGNSQKEIEELTNKLIQNSEEKISATEESLVTYRSLLEEHKKKLKEFKEKEAEAMREVKNSLEALNSCRSELSSIKSKLSLYKNEKCPMCSGDFRTEFYASIIKSLEENLIKFEEDSKILENQYISAKELENKIISSRAEFISKGNKIEMNIQALSDELRKLKTGAGDEQIGSLNKIMFGLKKDLEESNKVKFQEEEKQSWIKTLDEVLGEKGVKQLAVKSILPSLNKQILELLLELHLPYKVVFDEEFDAAIYHLGEEISNKTLSTGEMKKVDFAVLIAIIKLMKIRFSSVNLLFLDEIFSSVDPDGVHTILATLRKVCDEMGLNIFVINHAPMPVEIFDWRIDIQKKNQFSDLLMERTQ